MVIAVQSYCRDSAVTVPTGRSTLHSLLLILQSVMHTLLVKGRDSYPYGTRPEGAWWRLVRNEPTVI